MMFLLIRALSFHEIFRFFCVNAIGKTVETLECQTTIFQAALLNSSFLTQLSRL